MARIFLLFSAWFVFAAASADTLRVGVASNFKTTLIDLSTAFEAEYSHKLTASYASSGVLYQQILHGARFDLLLAADQRYPQLLEAKLGVAGSRFTYAIGGLVLAINPALNSPLNPDSEPQLLLQQILSNGKKIAIANPDTAPYGIAARQALTAMGLWQNHSSQIARGNNVAQAFQFVVTGNVAAALVAQSQALQSQTQQFKQLTYVTIDPHGYQPIQQQAILLQSASNNKAALAFMAFLKSAAARDIIAQHGYTLADQP
jgi:molybdate transport system substrate-binding protein